MQTMICLRIPIAYEMSSSTTPADKGMTQNAIQEGKELRVLDQSTFSFFSNSIFLSNLLILILEKL